MLNITSYNYCKWHICIKSVVNDFLIIIIIIITYNHNMKIDKLIL